MTKTQKSEEPTSGPQVRHFRILVANCRRCGREWPAHVDKCTECAAVVGEPRAIACQRLVPARTAPPITACLAVVLAVEVSRRRTGAADGWVTRTWAIVAPLFSGAVRVRPGRAGVVLAAWPLTGPGSIGEVADRALALRECLTPGGPDGVEVRGAIGVGVIDGRAASAAIERWVERLALMAGAGQCLVSEDAARQLGRRFEVRPSGVVSRWSLPLAEEHRALVSRLTPPVLPSAVTGDAPRQVLGRADERRRLLRELTTVAAQRRRRVVLVSAAAGGGKSYLLRRVLADSDLTLAAGVAFSAAGVTLVG